MKALLSLPMIVLFFGCSALQPKLVAVKTTNFITSGVFTPLNAIAPTHEVRTGVVITTYMPRVKTNGVVATVMVPMAPALPAPPLPDLSRPMPMRVPALKSAKILKVVPNISITRLATLTNGIVVDRVLLTPTPAKVTDFPPLPFARALTVLPNQLRAVKTEYDHKETWGNAYDFIYVSFEGMITNHSYRLNWIGRCPTNATVTTNWTGPPDAAPDVWTGLPKWTLAWVTWGVDSPAGSQLRFGVPVESPMHIVPKGHGFFRCEDMGQ